MASWQIINGVPTFVQSAAEQAADIAASSPAAVAAGIAAAKVANSTPTQIAKNAAAYAKSTAAQSAIDTAANNAAASLANDPATQLANLIDGLGKYLKGLPQGPLVALQALTIPQQQAYAQAITAYSTYHQGLGHTRLGQTGQPPDYAVDTSERGIQVLTYNGHTNEDYDQATLDAQKDVNGSAQAWCLSQGWSHQNNGLQGVSYWEGDKGEWARTANDYVWNNQPNFPWTCALMDLDINSQIFGDDSIYAYKKAIESFVQTGAGMAYGGVWPKGYADNWNNIFQAAHSKGKLLGQIFGPIIIAAGAVAAAFSVGGGAAAAGVGIGITEQAYQNGPPNPGPGDKSSGPIAVGQIAAGADNAPPLGPDNTTGSAVNLPPGASETGASALSGVVSSFQQFPIMWGLGIAAAFGLLVLVVVDS